ncbi:HD-GYP domain-containing protein [Reinekea blandensis]|uniref:HD-GYP domain n=1 Tax=Reinekea blandensis MED297 TaxID=314283 RepID=A4BG28_9GAMM|nr:HD-GYP domain-containing protein [Reinekea blandensis]EAR08823.1 HD-GYP domain [Reinekea sp. MED297] [Reinekea blandensis MED297]
MKLFERRDIEIPVEELEVGMHVVGIDRPWAETGFLLQSFIIQSQEEIHQLQAACQRVTIQARVASERETPAHATAEQRAVKSKVQRGPQSTERVRYLNQVSFERAVESSRLTFKSARSMASNIMEGLRVGRALNMEDCRTQVSEVVDRVLENADALRFLSMIKNKDDYTAEHSMNVCILSATFARHLGLQDFEIRLIALCGLLHDVGKCKVPLEILNKPGRFTKEEAHIMAEHTTHGRNILMSTQGDQRHVVDVAHCHHERLDGRGYPRLLSGGQIPYYAKIITIVDAYDAMTSERCYGKPKTSFEALRVVLKNAGTQFDPELARAFLKCIGLFPAGVLVELNSEQLAVVIKANDVDPDRPLLLVVTDAQHNRLQQPALVDLSQEANSGLTIAHEVMNGTSGIDVKHYIDQRLFS